RRHWPSPTRPAGSGRSVFRCDSRLAPGRRALSAPAGRAGPETVPSRRTSPRAISLVFVASLSASSAACPWRAWRALAGAGGYRMHPDRAWIGHAPPWSSSLVSLVAFAHSPFECSLDLGRHERSHLAVETCDLPDQAAADVRILALGHQENGFEL